MGDQGRKGTHASAGEALSRSHDKAALALVTRRIEAAPRYADAKAPTLTVTQGAGSADAPNATPPAAGAFLPGENRQQLALYADNDAGQTLDVEVWTRSDSAPGGSPLWLLVETISGLVAYAEHLVSTRSRDVYVRPVNVVTGGAADVNVYACLT